MPLRVGNRFLRVPLEVHAKRSRRPSHYGRTLRAGRPLERAPFLPSTRRNSSPSTGSVGAFAAVAAPGRCAAAPRTAGRRPPAAMAAGARSPRRSRATS
jgi:hypothetical protein